MSFTQTIEVEASDERALHDHLSSWDAEQSGVAPGYVGARLLADAASPGRYLIEANFSSEEEAARNNDRPETHSWATKLNELVTGEPRFTNYRLVYASAERR